uniref:Ras-specific guanine nucleotide-releasing factor RalGPS2 n=2 Tax=Cacopsylla melanoneura TaxID=428564 RepID=A0A8D8YG07_9HEMI
MFLNLVCKLETIDEGSQTNNARSCSMARMRYCEIPRDVSCTDSFATLRICKSKKSSLHSTSLNLEDEEYGRDPTPPSPSHPSPPRGYPSPHTPTTECWRKKKTSVTETLPSYESLKQNPSDDSTSSPCPPSPSSGRTKSQSLPCHATLSCLDSSLLSALRISPEDLASQLTLLDLAVFTQIRPEELTSCAWNSKHKLEVAPSVVAFTRRFNHVSFWAVQEILNCVPIKLRAETVAHFIRVGKKLFELNNFHSLFAIISALQSASVYRLSKTWSQLTKKERLTFEKLAAVFSDQNNWKNLREHVESLKLPCIPYLGMFLTDIVYIDMAHPSTGGLESAQRRAKMNNILRIIAHLQGSTYEDLTPLPHIQHHLKSIRYIEELQKFVEDDQYKLSLKLEPPTPAPTSTASSSNSKESMGCGVDHTLGSATVASLSLSPAKPPLRFHAPVSKFVPGHRKCRSLGTKGRSTSLPRNFHVGSFFGFQFIKTPEPRHLLDDSVLEVSSPPTPPSHHVPSLLLTARPHINPFNRDDSVVLQGCLRRKTMLKEGRRPTVAAWQRYWVQLWASTLVYYPPRSFKGHDRSDFKKEPCKMSHVQGCMMSSGDQPDVFLFRDPLRCNQYKFKALTPDFAVQWLTLLQHTAQSFVSDSKTPTNLISFE